MSDLSAFLETLKSRGFFEPGTSLVVARAPGRLDVMGGIADYSGSLVLQRPIAEATFAALQVTDEPVIEVVSLGRKPFTMTLASLAPSGEPISYDDARRFFSRVPEHHWAAYVIGVFLVLMRERGVAFARGARIVISSTVPEGKGVSSSAALETAAMQAVCAAFDVPLEQRDTALLCQKAENLVAGAPCGVMDQMTCVFGEADALMALLCQPAELQPSVQVQSEISFWGIDCGERHTVGGSDYASVRTGAFMGYRLMAENDSAWRGYLANVTPSEFEREFLQRLPEEMSGEDFLARYSGTTDTVTSVDPSRIYKIRRPTAHPIYEHHRVKMFRQLLLAPPGEEQRTMLGELMYQSHESYTACGLGSRGTDLIVGLARTAGPSKGLYGARITGGGSGGTVAVLGRSDAQPAMAQIVETYQNITGHRPYVFSGSSDGAFKWGQKFGGRPRISLPI
ncbi:MAG: GHMP kinase [Acidobacteria bacterium]|nr:GHMP kinase [Acidobacteriota bacterium]